MTRLGKIVRCGTAVVLALAVVGCQSAGTTGSDMGSAVEAAEVRTDREPIADRFPQLGAFVDAHWVGGRLGDDRAPGPSTYFIEAVITLSSDDVARLASSYDFARASTAPQPPASLAPMIEDDGPWLTSAELQDDFGPPDWVSNVFVRLDDGVAYVSARGE